jgi:hypothetical protein
VGCVADRCRRHRFASRLALLHANRPDFHFGWTSRANKYDDGDENDDAAATAG